MTDTATAPTPTKPAQASGHGQRLWAVLLVVDSFFVIIFGGALAAKLYQHWQAPAPDLAAQRRHHPAKAPAKAEAPAPAPAPAPSPAKPEPKAEPAKPAPAAASKEKAPGPPKPSLLQSAPAREAAKPHAASAASSPASAAPAAAGKAMPTEFSIKAPGARSVELVGAFIVHGGRKAMVSHPDGTWTLNLYLTPNTYRYWFVVNGKKTLDPQNPKIDRNASVVAVGQ